MDNNEDGSIDDDENEATNDDENDENEKFNDDDSDEEDNSRQEKQLCSEDKTEVCIKYYFID